jgi:O-antigen ligase
MWRRYTERTLIIATGLLVMSGAALLGGVHPASQLGLAVAALILFALTVAWRTVKKGRLTLGAPFWVLTAVAALCALQLWQLPSGALSLLQPRGTALLAYSLEGLGEPARRSLSLDPPGTALELAKSIGLVALAGTVALLVRDGPRALLLLWTCNVAGMALALLAAVQYLAGAEAVYWVYAPEAGRGFVAPFVNPNHAGAFYGALTFLNLGLSLRVRERRVQLAGAVLTALPALLVVASASRGAIVATALGAVLFAFLYWRTGEISGRRFGYAVALVLIGGTVAMPSSEIIRRELGERTDWQTLDEEKKIDVWRDAVAAVRDHPVAGVGRGAFRAAFPAYQRRTAGGQSTFTHPENLLVQWLVEVGPWLFGALLLGVFWLGVRYLRQAKLGPLHAVALCPVAVVVGQNLADFNLEFPGTAFLVVACLGVLAGLRRGRTRRVASARQRGLRAGGLLAAVAVAGVALATWGRWGAAHDLRATGHALGRRLERGEAPAAVLADARAAVRHHPADYYLHYLAGSAALRVPGEQPLRHFNRALYLNPRSTLTQYQVGRALQRLGLPGQALHHYLEALRLRLPLGGNFARDLFALLQRLWAADAAPRLLARVGACSAPAAATGHAPLPGCLLTAAHLDRHRGEPLGRVARIDPAAAYQLAHWLERVKLPAQARAAYLRLQAADPQRVEYLEALVRVGEASGDAGRALYWARRWVAETGLPEAYERLARLLYDARRPAAADRIVDAGLMRHRGHAPLVALKARLLMDHKQWSEARQLLVAHTVGRALDIKDEIRLLGLRIQVERETDNRMRAERLRSRLSQLQNLVKSGYQGLSPAGRR